MASQTKKAKRDKAESLAKPEHRTSEEVLSLCERVNCAAFEILCEVEASDSCISRTGEAEGHNWYHMSVGEHVCNNCLEFYSKTQSLGYAEYYKWKKVWCANGSSEPAVRTFISDQLLPYWLQCNRCSKWREMGRFFKFDRSLSEQFICTEGCDAPQDQRVDAARQLHWINTLLYPPYLSQSPAAVYVKGYYPDAVGLSASDSVPVETGGDNFARPFHEPYGACYALSVRPDIMDFDETQEFREFACAPQMYLCLRNLVVALWTHNTNEWLTLDKCRHSVICRGLVRVRCVQELEHIISFLTSRSLINFGILPSPVPHVFKKPNAPSVVVVGAGISGIAAAHHLNKLGAKVQILEVNSYIGGRICDTKTSADWLVSKGANIINGSINNPIAVMANQAKLIVQEYPMSSIKVLGKQNKPLPFEMMRKVENRYLQILDIMYEWVKSAEPKHDVSFMEKFLEIHQNLNKEDVNFLEEENTLLNLHTSLLSCSLGCDLTNVSAKYWNAHERFVQFGGPSFIVKQGLQAVLHELVAPLTCHLNRTVTSISQRNGRIQVSASSSNFDGDNAEHYIYTCDKVIVTVPLSCLQSKLIMFDPPLPDYKVNAINSLQCGMCEKISMHFKKKFWAAKMHGVRLFTSVFILNDPELPVHLFYDMSNNKSYTLVAYIYGDNVEKHCSPDNTYWTKCFEILKSIFPNAETPWHVEVSNWTAQSQINMSVSSVPVGVSDECCDIIAQPIDNKVYFAGEATQRSHPRSVTGAFLSGIRAAIEVLTDS